MLHDMHRLRALHNIETLNGLEGEPIFLEGRTPLSLDGLSG